MNIYDQAHELARALKDSEEYREYARLKDIAYEDDTNRTLLDEYKKMQFRMQARMASGERMDEEDFQKMQRISSLLQLNQDAFGFLMAEYRFQTMLSDIYKILADAAGIDLEKIMGG